MIDLRTGTGIHEALALSFQQRRSVIYPKKYPYSKHIPLKAIYKLYNMVIWFKMMLVPCYIVYNSY